MQPELLALFSFFMKYRRVVKDKSRMVLKQEIAMRRERDANHADLPMPHLRWTLAQCDPTLQEDFRCLT
jgi:hypothetical protein